MQYGAVTDIRDLKEVPIGAEKCQGTGDDTMNSRKITCASFLFGGEHINKGKTHYGHAYASPSGGFSWFKRRIQGMSWVSDTIKIYKNVGLMTPLLATLEKSCYFCIKI